uniref:pH-sensitive chloride channel 2 n=1 Tax=Ciona intestinalis TaxID=7719 RepID=A0A455QRK1_CIOIN|nr:Ci-GABAAR-pi subunit [Ciona intestinalis]
MQLVLQIFVLSWLLINTTESGRGGPQSRYWRNPLRNLKYGAVVETMLDPDRYHKYIRPGIDTGKPIVVNVSLSVTGLDRISDADMEYTVTFTLHQLWKDTRLDGTKSARGYSQILTMDGSLGNRIWVPDTYIVNSHTSFIHDVTTRNGLIRLYPDGTVLYVLRITSTVSCTMKLHKYPMDEQACKLALESWSFTEQDLIYKWDKEESCGSPSGSVTGMDNIVLLQFNLTKCSVYRELHSAALGNYSQLILEFRLKRNMLFFLMQTYLPSVLLVILSWVSFWINMNSVPARVGLGATTVLSMTTLMIGVYNSGPKSTSYIKAIDFYVCVCYGFIFAALMEYAGAHFTVRRYATKANKLLDGKHNDCKNKPKNGGHVEIDIEEEAVFSYPVNDQRECEPKWQTSSNTNKLRAVSYSEEDAISKRGFSDFEHSTFSTRKRNPGAKNVKNGCVVTKIKTLRHRVTRLERIDEYSRIIFPVAFVGFNAVYWWVYLTMDDQ